MKAEELGVEIYPGFAASEVVLLHSFIDAQYVIRFLPEKL